MKNKTKCLPRETRDHLFFRTLLLRSDKSCIRNETIRSVISRQTIRREAFHFFSLRAELWARVSHGTSEEEQTPEILSYVGSPSSAPFADSIEIHLTRRRGTDSIFEIHLLRLDTRASEGEGKKMVGRW